MTSKLMRVWQLVRSLRARPLNAQETEYLRGLLNEKQAALFVALVPYEQRHALNVCRTLAAGGFGADRELMQAALLHDLGKRDHATGRYVPLWGKCANVALSALGGPRLIARLASPDPRSWCYIFYLQSNHETRSAELAREAGSSSKVVTLVAHSQIRATQNDPALQALQWADDLN